MKASVTREIRIRFPSTNWYAVLGGEDTVLALFPAYLGEGLHDANEYMKKYESNWSMRNARVELIYIQADQ